MIEIYTDGACAGNPGPGGWAATLHHTAGPLKDSCFEITGGEPLTTNNRMELMAVISALEHIAADNPLPVVVHSDSAYIVNCIKDRWYAKWQSNGWKTSGKKSVENRDLWERLLPLVESTQCNLVKVKGHSTNAKNNRCDQLAVRAAQRFK